MGLCVVARRRWNEKHKWTPYPSEKPLHRDSESPCGWRARRLRTRQMNNAIQPLDSKRIKGLLLSRQTPEIWAFLGFLFACGKTLLRAIQSGYRQFRRAYKGCMVEFMISGVAPQNWNDYRQLHEGFHEHFRGLIFKREKGSASNALPDSRRTAEPTAFPRVLTAFARFFAPVGRKKAVCQVCI